MSNTTNKMTRKQAADIVEGRVPATTAELEEADRIYWDMKHISLEVAADPVLDVWGLD